MIPGIHRPPLPPREPPGDGDLPGPTRPDRIPIWPVEQTHFGIDVHYHGATGFRRADRVQGQLEAAGALTRSCRSVPDARI